MDKVVHFEIPVDDIARAQTFYKIFNWRFREIPGMDYVGIHTVETDEKRQPTEPGAINGGMFKRSAEVRAPVVAINVASIDQALEKVLKAGGNIVMPKMEIQGVGYYAYITDTEGNVVGLWQEIKH